MELKTIDFICQLIAILDFGVLIFLMQARVYEKIGFTKEDLSVVNAMTDGF